MKLLLTSFGINIDSINNEDGSALKSRSVEGNYFFRMPAVSMGAVGTKFVPDYSVFLLYDEFVVDAESWSELQKRGGASYFSQWLPLLEAFEAEGRLQVVDFVSELKPYIPVIRLSVESDMRSIATWAPAFEELAARWKGFAEMGRQMLAQKEEICPLSAEERRLGVIFCDESFGMFPVKDDVLDALKNWGRRLPPYLREQTKQIVALYLEYVACNIVLTRLLDGVVHEWADIEPLYLRKADLALEAGKRPGAEEKGIRKLFQIMTPDFVPADPRKLVKALGDRRLAELRQLVRNSALQGTEFDEAFATRTLLEILQSEQKLGVQRRILAWATAPVHLIPWVGTPAQVAVESAIMSRLESRARHGKEWFFLISDIARGSRGTSSNASGASRAHRL